MGIKKIFTIIINMFQNKKNKPVPEKVKETGNIASMFHALVGNVQVPELSDEEYREVQKRMVAPYLYSLPEDRTYEGWLTRIAGWGNIRIRHKTVDGIEHDFAPRALIDYMSNMDLYRSYGAWKLDPESEYTLEKCVYYREYLGIDGEKVRETITVTVDLKDSLKKRMKRR